MGSCKFEVEGRPCSRSAGVDPSGYCSDHLPIVMKIQNEVYQKCSDCHIQDSCTFNKYKGIDACYFEQFDDCKEWADKETVIKGMKRLLNIEMRIIRRSEKKLLDTESRVDKDGEIDTRGERGFLVKTIDLAQNHIEKYGQFRGWDKKENINPKDKKDKLKKVFSREATEGVIKIMCGIEEGEHSDGPREESEGEDRPAGEPEKEGSGV